MNFVEKLADRVTLIARGKDLYTSEVEEFRRKFGREYLKLRYLLPGRLDEIIEEVLIGETFSEQTLLDSVYERGDTLLEFRRDLQPLDAVVGAFLQDDSRDVLE